MCYYHHSSPLSGNVTNVYDDDDDDDDDVFVNDVAFVHSIKMRYLNRANKYSRSAATWRGRSFQTVAPETGNASLPTVHVDRRTGGTSRRCEVEDHSRRLDVMSETRVKHDFR